MKRFAWKFALAAAVGGSAVAIAADDVKPDAKAEVKPEAKAARPAPADWSKFVRGEDVSGVVVKGGADGFTLRVSGVVATPKSKSANPLQGRSRSRNSGVTLKEQHIDYDLKYADNGLPRWKTLPPKLDSDGKKVPYTDKERAALAEPTGAPGYAADKSELAPGHIVTVQLVRPRDIPAAKATADDWLVKYAVISGMSPNPPKADKADKKDEAPKKKK